MCVYICIVPPYLIPLLSHHTPNLNPTTTPTLFPSRKVAVEAIEKEEVNEGAKEEDGEEGEWCPAVLFFLYLAFLCCVGGIYMFI